jgi:hypothetical protein
VPIGVVLSTDVYLLLLSVRITLAQLLCSVRVYYDLHLLYYIVIYLHVHCVENTQSQPRVFCHFPLPLSHRFRPLQSDLQHMVNAKHFCFVGALACALSISRLLLCVTALVCVVVLIVS